MIASFQLSSTKINGRDENEPLGIHTLWVEQSTSCQFELDYQTENE